MIIKNTLNKIVEEEFLNYCSSSLCYWQHYDGFKNDVFYHLMYNSDGIKSNLFDKLHPLFTGIGLGFTSILVCKILKIPKIFENATLEAGIKSDNEEEDFGYYNILYCVNDNDVKVNGESLNKGEVYVCDSDDIKIESNSDISSNFIWLVLKK